MRASWLILFVHIFCNVAVYSGSIFDHKDCRDTEFSCADGQCITKSKRCDGIRDCKDDSDEHDCERFHCAEPNWYKCTDGECISASFRCDKSIDCPSGSDEHDCEGFVYTPPPTNHTCEPNEWMCTDRLCIPLEFVCNGNVDCLDESDEKLGCTDHHTCDGFRCKNGHCIDEEWVCDGANDCTDNSDEISCDDRPVTFMCILEHDHFPCRDNSSCIPANKVCDNIPHCKDKSDEGLMCKQECTHLSCEKHCIRTPLGPRCVCPHGFHNPVNADLYHMHHWATQTNNNDNCTDINECAITGMCSQKCENTIGSYRCSCDAKYTLGEDKRSCKVSGGEALLLFSSRTNIRGLYLESHVLFQVVKKQRQIIGVEYDGNHVYWTDVHFGSESILRSLEDGSQMEVLLTSGLSAPEDLALDWLTGNIYFTDAELMRIGVCSNDGKHCAIIVNENVHKPRAIALYPGRGQMFWSDWGDSPQIATSFMDGSAARQFVNTDLHWPNGISIDIPNKKLYWVDAKLKSIESINLDGTGRRVVLKGVVKHPYAIVIFEDNIYWSDWHSRSIQSCDKFTCKNRTTVAKETEYIYGIHIYHSALQPKHEHACMKTACSHLCLLRDAHDYTCACPEGKELAIDKISCRDNKKATELLIGAGNMIVSLIHQTLGRQELHGVPFKMNIDVLAYNSLTGEVIVADNNNKFIYAVDLVTAKVIRLTDIGNGHVEAMQFDNMGNNLFWIDSHHRTVEVLHFDTGVRGLIIHDLGDQIPVGFAIVPSHGIMFIAFRTPDHAHIDRLFLDGSGARTHVIEDGLGKWGKIPMVYDESLQRVFWAVEENGRIESTSIDGDDRHSFRHTKNKPISLAILGDDIFWTTEGNRRLYWGNKHNIGLGLSKKLTIDIDLGLKSVPLTAITPRTTSNHICNRENGGCSHICIPMMQGKASCHCPVGLSLMPPHNMTCAPIARCSSEQFRCKESNRCIPLTMRCNGNNDCENGEDEYDCDSYRKHPCAENEFQCHDGSCVQKHYRCDKNFDCPDKSDEENCEHYDNTSKCTHSQFECEDGQCIDNRLVCDFLPDCLDGSDEKICDHVTCEKNMFQCQTGSCIPATWECDGEKDCTDTSDEHGFCEILTCSDDQFACTNKKCIDIKLKCNHEDDCGDGSDEILCPVKETRQREQDIIDLVTCNPTEFTCEESGSCVPEVARCNGTAECKYGEDERECENCQLDEFTCTSGQCIQQKWVCDKTKDCEDGSDETVDTCSKVTTQQPIHAQFLPVCDKNSFRCKSGGCVDFTFVCNGVPDCYDGSDEDGACGTSCNTVKCKHECRPTPNGPQCFCHEGYRLDNDHLACIDIDECSGDTEYCGQICKNTQGSFQCSCYEDYMLRSDKRTCKAVGDPMSILYATTTQIRKLSLSPPSLKILIERDMPNILGMDISIHTNTLYFSLDMIEQIYSLNLNDGSLHYIMNIGKPSRLAVDWITQNIYFISEDTIQKTLRVCHIENAECAVLIKFDKNIAVPELAIDPISRYIFYTVTHWWIYDNPITVLYRANLDGSHITELHNENLKLISGISIDNNKQTIYFTDKHKNTIESMSYDGSNHRILIQEQKLLRAPHGLDVFEDYAYTLVSGSSRMLKCRTFGNYACSVIDVFITTANVFKIQQASKQRINPDICANSKCMFLCVAADSGPKCICSDGSMITPGIPCPHDDVLQRPQFGHVPQESSHGSSALIVSMLILTLIVTGGTTYYFYRKKTGARSSIFKGMRFVTPGYGRPGRLGERSPAMVQILKNIAPGKSEHGKLSGVPVKDAVNVEKPSVHQNPMVLLDSDSDGEPEKYNEIDTTKLLL